MKIKIKVGFSGIVGSFAVGEIVDLPKKYAQAYIKCGYAEALTEKAIKKLKTEKAVKNK